MAGGEKLPLDENSTDLVTCAQSFHWLDESAFYKELDRVLKPNGVIALLTYEMPFVHLPDNKSESVRQLMRNFYHHRYLKTMWSRKERDLVDSAYETVQLPYPDQVRINDSVINDQVSGADMAGYITSWSGFNSLREKEADKSKELLAEFEKAVLQLTGDFNTNCFSIEFPFHLLMARKC